MNSADSRMAKDTLIFLPAKLLEGIITMAQTAFFTDLFNTDSYGIYQMVNTNVLFLYLISVCWLLNASVRFVGDAKENPRPIFSTVSICMIVISGAAILLSAAAFMITADPIYIACACFFISYSVFQLANGMLVQLSMIRTSVLLSLAVALIKLFGTYFFAAVFSGGTNTPYPAIAASIAADLTASLIALFLLRVHHFFSFHAFSQKHLSSFLSFGLPLVGFSVSVGLLNMADRYIVSFLCGNDSFAVYSANYSISSGLFTLLTTAVMRGVYPNVLRGFREGGAEGAKPLLNSGVRLYLLIAVPAAFGLFAVGPTLCQSFFTKSEYHSGAFLIGIAAFVMLFMGLTEYANKAFELTSHTLPILQSSLISAVFKVAATFALVWLFGFYGAAAASLLSFLFYFLLSKRRAKKIFCYQLSFASTCKIVVSAVFCAMTASLTLMLPLPPILGLSLAVAVGGATYVAALAALGEITQELAAVKRFAAARLTAKSGR